MNDLEDSVRRLEGDRQIDTALDLVRQASASPDFLLRMRRRLAEHRQPAQRKPFRWEWPAVAATAAAVSLSVWLCLSHRPARHLNTSASYASANVGVPGTPIASQQSNLLSRSDRIVSDGKRRPHLALRSAALRSTAHVVTSAPAPGREFVATKPSSEAAFDHPAPELPLTAQEQMLLRIAYGNRPLQLASLKRFILPRSADDETDFDKFFEPYTIPLTEGNPQ